MRQIMTNRLTREQDRAVRAYKRAHPGITWDQARAAVAARSGQRHSLPARIPGAPLPRPGERLEGYVQRVAAAVGVQRHRAMVLLGLEPGTSATERLDELAAYLPDRTVRALVAATGMTGDQARALSTSPTSAADAIPALVRLAQQLLNEKSIQRGGEGKTRTDARELVRLLAEADRRRRLPFDTYPAHRLEGSALSAARPVLVDLPWATKDITLPADPGFVEEILKEYSVAPGPHGGAAE